MRRRLAKIAAWTGGILLALVIAAGIAGIMLIRSDWLREKVRERIVGEAQVATGGRVEIGSFRFDWESLTAEIDKLVIHGREAADQAPLLAVEKLSVGLRIISLMKREFDVASVRAEQPRVHVIVGRDGRTNLPEPGWRAGSKSVPQTILDLKIGSVALQNASFLAESPGFRQERSGWSAKGEHLAARVNYAAPKADAGPRYEGEFSLAPLHLALDGLAPFDASVRFIGAMEKDRVTVSRLFVKTAGSEAEFTRGLVNGFARPVATARYRMRVSLREADRIFKLVNFQHVGTLDLDGDARFASARDYQASGTLRGAGIQYGTVKQLGVSGRFTAQPDRIDLAGLRVKALGGDIKASGEIRNLDTFHVNGTLDHFDADDLAGLAGLRVWANQPRPLPYDGLVAGVFDATGFLSEPQLHRINATATVSVSPVPGEKPAQGQITARYDGNTNIVELGNSWIELPASRVDVSGVFGKTLNVRLRSKDLADLLPALGGRSFPFELRNGSVAFDGTVTGPIGNPQIAGHGEFANAVLQGRQLESLVGDVQVSETGLKAQNVSLAWGQTRARGSGSVGLINWIPGRQSPVSANLQVATPDIPGLQALAGVTNNSVTGTLNTTVALNGTFEKPDGSAQFTLSKGQAAGEPYDSIAGRLQITPAHGATLEATASARAMRLRVSGQFDPAGPAITDGKLTFSVASNTLPLAQIALVRKWQPTLGGTAEFKAGGAFQIEHSTGGKFRFSLPDLNADVATTGLTLGDRSFGNARLTATTRHNILTAKLESGAAQTTVQGEGTVSLTGQYPLEATLHFASPDLRSIAELVSPGSFNNVNFEGAAEGEVKLRGEARAPDRIAGTAELSRVEIRPAIRGGQTAVIAGMVLRNDGPVTLSLNRTALKVERARFLAQQTTLGVSGTIGFTRQSFLDLNIQGNVNMALAQTFSPDLSAIGDLQINAGVRGTFANPDFSGTADLQKAGFRYAEFTNGLTNATGVIRFSGSRANIQTFSAETGGGKVDATGFITLVNGIPAFRLEVKARQVRIRYPEGVSSVSDGDLTLAGTAERSEASGRITIRRVSINPQSDLSTILAASAQPFRTSEARSGLLSNLNFDVQVDTAPDVDFQTNVAQRIQADASLLLRGTATSPAMLGRINITQGEMVFFSNKYTISQGSISFFNPAKIDPILNLDLDTKARGVDVTLTVAGPISKLNVSYRSDPPLQFADIIGLLATGRTPTDPTLAVRDTGQSQSLQQIGASALLGQAIANPVAGRLQRFFGVARIKIDPSLTGVTGSPEARLTLEQQVTPDLLFTYVSDVSNTSTQLVRVEWSFNRRWSAVLTRAENGYVDLDFAFKKSFK
jgi:translocation and assembly module TamB